MSFLDLFNAGTEYVLFATCIFILAGSIYISFKLRFVQLRVFSELFKMVRNSRSAKSDDKHTISPYKALVTAMSTTLGITTIVGPVLAINLAGPGALLGYLLTSFFGSAATYAEVHLGVQHRKRLESGSIMGGPMQYISHLISPFAAKWYAVSGLILLAVWSGAQSNQLAAIFDSPLLGSFRIPTVVSGLLITALVLVTLMGGIKRIASLSSKLVPTMFGLYLFGCFWILFANLDQLGVVLHTMFESVFSPYQMATGTVIGGIVSTVRWGIFKGTQTTEAGVGTQSIPHSMAETSDPDSQAILAVLSTYAAGFLAFLSGCVALITNTWQDPNLPLGMSMVAATFEMYFSTTGIVIVTISSFLFAFGTIIGNSYNGSQCFGYLTNNRGIFYYFLAASSMIFIGAISEVKTVWSMIDIVLAFMVIPHMAALILGVSREEVGNTKVEKPVELEIA